MLICHPRENRVHPEPWFTVKGIQIISLVIPDPIGNLYNYLI